MRVATIACAFTTKGVSIRITAVKNRREAYRCTRHDEEGVDPKVTAEAKALTLLFCLQRVDRIHASRSPRWDVTRQRRRAQQPHADHHIRSRINGAHLKQQ